LSQQEFIPTEDTKTPNPFHATSTAKDIKRFAIQTGWAMLNQVYTTDKTKILFFQYLM